MTPGLATARLIRLEMRHNAMLWLLPAFVAIFWFSTYRKTMALPPMWNLRVTNLQTGAVVDFIVPVVGAATWIGSRETRRRTREVVTTTAWPPWSRLLVTWAATTCWALAGYLACVTPVYWITAHQASWGGPLWWPAVVAGATLPMLTALGFAAGTLAPSRFTAPAVAVLAFFTLVLSTELLNRPPSYWQISPLVSGPWDFGPGSGVATFYPYQPDLPIAQVMFLAGLTAAILAGLVLAAGAAGFRPRVAAAVITASGLLVAGTAVALAGTGTLDTQGMIDIPALHDAASDRPLRFSPVCSRTAILVCLNPAYARYLPAVTAALDPVLRELAGVPGAPARITQVPATYRQGPGNEIDVRQSGPGVSGRDAVTYRILLPDQLLGPVLTISQLASLVRVTSGPDILAAVVGNSPAASPAQHAIWAGLMLAAGLRVTVKPAVGPVGQSGIPGLPAPQPEIAAGSAVLAAARRFAALPALARRHWLELHLASLRAGRLTLGQLP
jgi:hypothetical protein